MDFAEANFGGPNSIYINNGFGFDLEWLSFDSSDTKDVAWADVDGDGDLDLMSANADQPNHLYESDQGTYEVIWSSKAADNSTDLAWGDVDGDGDLDLAVANATGVANHVYENQNGFLSLMMRTTEEDGSHSVAWADIDGDGDLELAVASWQKENHIYWNRLLGPTRLPDSPTTVTMSPLGTDDIAGPGVLSVANTISSSILEVDFQLKDLEGDPAALVALQYSVNQGGKWWPATTSGPTQNLETHKTGYAHSLLWDLEADGVYGDGVMLRLVVVGQSPHYSSAVIMRAEISVTAGPVRVQICGNSVKEPGEQCDDGNQLPGDGCSATCQAQ